jgi:pyruvate formate lyase activating enzyme
MQDLNAVRGCIFDIQRYSVHDGPGIRTIAFLKGCPLRCKWCCNPESFTREPQTIVLRDEPQVTGREITVGELVDVFLKDMIYYRRSKNGGITLSGGESLFQPDFAEALLQVCRQKSLHTAIETTGFADYAVIERYLPWLNLVMLDIKHMSPQKHKEFTGVDNARILENARRLAAQKAVEVIIRVPVVPGFNNTVQEIAEIAAFVSTLPEVKQLHLLPYHRLGEAKYKGLGMEYPYAGVEPMAPGELEPLLETAKLISGVHCQIGEIGRAHV